MHFQWEGHVILANAINEKIDILNLGNGFAK
jgi:hypothetical protein